MVYFEDTKSYLKDYLRKAMKASCQFLLIYQDLMKLDTQPNISLSIKLWGFRTIILVPTHNILAHLEIRALYKSHIFMASSYIKRDMCKLWSCCNISVHIVPYWAAIDSSNHVIVKNFAPKLQQSLIALELRHRYEILAKKRSSISRSPIGLELSVIQISRFCYR